MTGPTNTASELYGDNAVTGRPEETPNPLEGREVKIITTNTQSVKVDENDDQDADQKPDKDPNAGPDTEPDGDPEAITQADVEKTLAAEKDAKKVLAAKGIEWAGLEQEFAKDGQLSEASYKKLAEAGFPRTVVDAYVAGLQAVSERFVNQVVSYAGGREQFQAMAKFIASQGEAEVAAFNDLIENGKLSVIKTAIEGYKARMVSKFGTNNPTIMGSPVATQAVEGFASKEELVKAMSDRRYGRDPKYTREVEARTVKSKFIRIR